MLEGEKLFFNLLFIPLLAIIKHFEERERKNTHCLCGTEVPVHQTFRCLTCPDDEVSVNREIFLRILTKSNFRASFVAIV